MEQLFGAIPTVLNGLEPNANIDRAVVFAAWLRCAGDLLRSRTAVLDFSDKRLVIAVQDQTWQRHLEELSPQMLVKINGSLGHGTVKFIEFRIDAKAVRLTREIEKDNSSSESAKVTPSLALAAEAITDENLRTQFLGAAGAYLAKQKLLGDLG